MLGVRGAIAFRRCIFQKPNFFRLLAGSGPVGAAAAAAAASLAFANLILRITLGGTAFGLGVPCLVPCLDSVIAAAPIAAIARFSHLSLRL